jgi:hypothetical protein
VLVLVMTAAYRRAIEAHVAGAAVFAALLAAFAAGLQGGAALLVAAGATDGAAVIGVLALAVAVRKRALAALQAILRAAAAAQTVAQHAAKVLQRSARQFVVAMAVDFASAVAFFELDLATRHHAPLSACGRTAGVLPRMPLLLLVVRRRSGCKAFHHNCTRHRKLLSS